MLINTDSVLGFGRKEKHIMFAFKLGLLSICKVKCRGNCKVRRSNGAFSKKA